MDFLEAIILGIVQGLTEFLPISSSGHLALCQEILGFDKTSIGIEFDLLLHFATLLAVLIYFRKKLSLLFSSIFRKERHQQRKMIWLLFLGTIPVVISGFFLKDDVEHIRNQPVVVSALLCLTGVFLFIPNWIRNKTERNNGNRTALIIGCSQALAILPGISRSGSTIATGMALGIPPKLAAEFSFLLAIPAISGATLLKMNEFSSIPPDQLEFYAGGMIAAFLTGLLAIFCVLNLIRKGKFSYFGFYCILIGTTGLIYFSSR